MAVSGNIVGREAGREDGSEAKCNQGKRAGGRREGKSIDALFCVMT